MRPEDSESIEVKIIVDESAGERLVDVARWLMATGTDYRFRAGYETHFRAYVPILLLPELAHLRSVRNIKKRTMPPMFPRFRPHPFLLAGSCS